VFEVSRDVFDGLKFKPRHATSFFDVLPFSSSGGFQYGVADVLSFQSVAEVGAGAFFVAERLDEVGDLMHEGVFVADLRAGHPPIFLVGMFAVGDVDDAPSAGEPAVFVIEKLQAMKVVQVPEDRPVLAVDFECVEGFVAARVTSRFEGRERAVVEMREESARVVDADFFFFCR